MANIPAAKPTFEVIADLDRVAREVLEPGQQYYVVGGTATAAILHPDSVFDHQDSRLIAAPGSGEPTIRDNGTKRDLDFLVLDVISKDRAKAIQGYLGAAINNELVVSVFGLKRHTERRFGDRLIGGLGAWISRRTIDENGVIRYELFPLQQEVPRDSFDPWWLETAPGEGVAILNPAAHELAYETRSISGIRDKDYDKVERMRARILAEPEFKQQIEEGNLVAWNDFARALSFLTTIGSTELIQGLLPAQDIKEWDRKMAHAKAYLLGMAESYPTIVRYAQRGIVQTLTKPFTGST